MPARDHYLIGKLGSYLCPTVDHVDGHLRALRLRLRLTCDLTARQRDNTRADVDALLDRRQALARVSA